MITIWLFNLALVCGIAASQMANIDPFKGWLLFLTKVLLAYIMIQVGLEFIVQKKKWKNYLVDYGVASLAAGLPWMFCFLYFLMFDFGNWQENLLLARFAAPTATGILFSMLGLAGLGMTWMFKKIEVLVIFDDLDTILFLVPLQFLLSGGHSGLVFVAITMVFLIIIGWRYMHALKLPANRFWIFFYAVVIGSIAEWLNVWYQLEVEVLLPAFILGLVLHSPHGKKARARLHEQSEITSSIISDRSIKWIFMFLVGLLLPPITLNACTLKSLGLHVLFITLLMNFGKLAPIFFYRKEASLRERLAVAVGMMPRGEMGAGILTIALAHGIKDLMAQAAALSLALNLLLTGVFIAIVMKLLKPKQIKGL